MAVRSIPPSVGNSYEGLAGDDKPTGVVINSTFREQDTQAVWITYDGTTWVLKEPIGEVKASPTAYTLLSRLKDLLTGITLAAGVNVIGKVDSAVSGISDGREVVAEAGTALALASSTVCKYVFIAAESDNTGVIVVGGTTVVADLATRQGIPLNAGEKMGFPIDNLADVYIDSTVTGDGVTFTYLT